MQNPFTTIQNWFDKRQTNKNQEFFARCAVGEHPDAEGLAIVEKVKKDLLTKPEVGTETTFTYYDEKFKATVTNVDGAVVTVTITAIHEYPTLDFNAGTVTFHGSEEQTNNN